MQTQSMSRIPGKVTTTGIQGMKPTNTVGRMEKGEEGDEAEVEESQEEEVTQTGEAGSPVSPTPNCSTAEEEQANWSQNVISASDSMQTIQH
jgi:hypothetical protein